MTALDPRALAERLIQVWNTHATDRVAELYAPTCRGVDVAYAAPLTGREAVMRQMERYFRAFPDLHFVIEDSLAADNRIALVWLARGTHRGTLMNIPPTGRPVEIRGMSMLTFQDGLITDALYVWDVAGLLRSIGLLPDLARTPDTTSAI